MSSTKLTKAQKKKKHAARVLLSFGIVLTLTVLIILFADRPAFMSAIDKLAAMSDTPAPESAAPATPSAVLPTPDAQAAELDIYVLDVGHGDCIFLRSSSGKTMLVDAGEQDMSETVQDFLDAHNVKALDVIVATHPHSDHIGGMANLIDRYGAGEFYMPDKENATYAYENMMKALEKRGISPVRLYAGAGSELPWDTDVQIDVLSPYKGSTFDDMNDWSLVLRISYGANSILLTGDAESEAEAVMLAMCDPALLVADVLKVGHHGSYTSTSRSFLTAVSPKSAIISRSSESSTGYSLTQTLERLAAADATCLRTDESGNIHLRFTGTQIFIEPER